jgi:hypothetical protein
MRYAKIYQLRMDFIFLSLIYLMFALQDEYFEVDNLKTKHDGYFVNKGKLEQM